MTMSAISLKRSALLLPVVLCWAAAQAAAPAAQSDSQIVAGLGDHLAKLAAHDQFSGAVLVAKNGKVVFAHAYGYANHGFNVPNKVDTKFNLGSMGKMFTGVAVLQLAQAGKLSLDDKLIKLVPDYPDQDIASKITIYQLLTHTSGLGDMFNDKYRNTPKDQLDTIQAHLPLFTGKPLQFEPGTKWSYSNAGFIVLGLVVERVSGQSYYDYVREHIFKPAGMLNTDNFKPHDDVPNMAVGYTSAQRMGDMGRRTMNLPGGLPATGPRITNSDFLQPGASAGGGYSTVEDLLRFSQALQSYKLLNKEYTDLYMTGKVVTGRGTAKYSFGISEDFINGVRIVGHAGGGPGINSNLDMYPQTGYAVAVMTNLDNAVSLANERIRLWLTGQKLPAAVHLSAEALQAFAGTYTIAMSADAPPAGATAPAASMEIAADREGLWLTSGAKHRLLPLSATEFFDDNMPTLHFTFTKDESGRINGFSFAGPGGRQLKGIKQ